MDIRDEAIEVMIEKAASLFGKDASEFSADTSFKDDLGCTSSNIVMFCAALEEEFDVEVPYMEMARRKTFGEAADLIEELLG